VRALLAQEPTHCSPSRQNVPGAAEGTAAGVDVTTWRMDCGMEPTALDRCGVARRLTKVFPERAFDGRPQKQNADRFRS